MPLETQRRANSAFSRRTIMRAGALASTAIAGLASLRAKGQPAWSAAPTASSEAALATSSACTTLTEETTQGPFWVDERLNRSDIRADSETGDVETGVPLTLTVYLTDASAQCSPFVGAFVDVWHANSQGAYSDVSGSGNPDNVGVDWLRGYQTSDSNGAVTFTTIYPGWYVSRAIHIHFRVRLSLDSSTTVNFTSQLFFDELVSSTVLQDSRYKADSSQRTTNDADSIYDAALLVPVIGSTSAGYSGSFTVNLAFDDSTATPTTTTTPNPSATATPTTATPSTGPDEVVDATVRRIWVDRRRGKRVVFVQIRAEERVAAKLRLIRGDDVIARRNWGWLGKGRRRLRVVVTDDVRRGPAVVQLNLADAAGNSHITRRHIHLPGRLD